MPKGVPKIKTKVNCKFFTVEIRQEIFCESFEISWAKLSYLFLGYLLSGSLWYIKIILNSRRSDFLTCSLMKMSWIFLYEFSSAHTMPVTNDSYRCQGKEKKESF